MDWALFLLILSMTFNLAAGYLLASYRKSFRLFEQANDDNYHAACAWEEYSQWLEHRGWEVEGQHTQVPPLDETRVMLREQYAAS